MKSSAAVVAAAMVIVAAQAGPAEMFPSDRAAGERVERYLDRLDTLRAEFVQQLIDKDGVVREESSGVLALAKPGRFRWDYRQPAEQLLVSDGSTIWLYDADLEQVTVRPVGDSLSHTPAMLLAGQGQVAETFMARDAGSADGLEWVVLTPRVADADFSSVRLGFRGQELERLDLEDRLGQTTRIAFLRIERNPGLPQALFTFVPPPGVDVVGAPAAR